MGVERVQGEGFQRRPCWGHECEDVGSSVCTGPEEACSSVGRLDKGLWPGAQAVHRPQAQPPEYRVTMCALLQPSWWFPSVRGRFGACQKQGHELPQFLPRHLPAVCVQEPSPLPSGWDRWIVTGSGEHVSQAVTGPQSSPGSPPVPGSRCSKAVYVSLRSHPTHLLI